LTRVNRCLTEGRQALTIHLAGIQGGIECSRMAPLLSALADGEATAEQLALLRPHMKTCLACRARLREFRAAPARVAALVPAAAMAADDAVGRSRLEVLADTAHQKLDALLGGAQQKAEAMLGAAQQKAAARRPHRRSPRAGQARLRVAEAGEVQAPPGSSRRKRGPGVRGERRLTGRPGAWPAG
jgi:hypothetical protein